MIGGVKNGKYCVGFKVYEDAVDGSKHGRWKTKKAYILNADMLSKLEMENLIDIDIKKDGKIIEVDFADSPF